MIRFFLTPDEFGCLQWAPNEKHVMYVAEKKRPKTEPFYKQTAPKNDKAGFSDDQPLKVSCLSILIVGRKVECILFSFNCDSCVGVTL